MATIQLCLFFKKKGLDFTSRCWTQSQRMDVRNLDWREGADTESLEWTRVRPDLCMYWYQSSIYRYACCRKCCIHVRLIASAIDKQTDDMYDIRTWYYNPHSMYVSRYTIIRRRGRQKRRKTRWWWWRWWKGLDSWKTMVHGTNLSWDWDLL